MTTTRRTAHSPFPWAYEYDPRAVRPTAGGPAVELPAFEVFDDDGNKVFDTDGDAPADRQEANARLAVLVPDLLEAVRAFLAADALAEECGERKWENLDHAFTRARAVMDKVP